MVNDPAVETRAMELLEQALDLPENEREAWIDGQTTEPDVRSRALRMLSAMMTPDRRLSTGAFTDLQPVRLPDRIGGYRVIGLLGQGGMGTVFKAERDAGDFEHKVAIKVIRPGILDPSLVERFERERQILANLSHPGIARLYDGGTTEGGRPYIVMELIDGIAVTRWSDSDGVGIDDRLRLILEVCDAVSFAHQNLIIHRDLNPNNILVTPEGHPKLFDFGIARPLDDRAFPQTSEAAARLSLTPGYAAPERFHGGPSTTLTDIYSLGKLCESLLGPDCADPDLRAIVDKATAPEPGERYASVGDLARDLRHFVDGYPVEARGGARLYALRKFVARNRGQVVAGALGLVLLIGALAAASLAYLTAERERARAQQSFADTRAIARSMMFDIYDEVSRVPGSVAARLALADTAQRYLESLAGSEGADADVRFDAAKGYFRLAEVVGARSGGGTIGQTSRAKAYYGRSLSILEALHREYPDRSDIRSVLGQVITVLSDSALFSDGDFERAKARARKARLYLDGLVEADGRNAAAYAATYLHEGNALAFEGEPEPAGEAYRRGLALIAGLPPALAGSIEVRRAAAELHRMTGAYHLYFGRPDEAGKAVERALRTWRAIAKASEFRPTDIYGLVTALQSAAQMKLASGDRAQAETLAGEAVELARRAMRESPNDAGPRELLSVVAILKGLVLAQAGDFREAQALADEAIRHKRDLVRVHGDVVSGPMTLAVRLQEASEVYLLAGRRDKACPIMREASAIMLDYAKTAELPIANRRNNLDPMIEALREC